MHGRGKYIYADGREYDGEWIGGYKQGNGIFKYANGDTYTGEFYQDLFEGYGVFTFADGRIHKGEYQHDKKQGYGVLIKTDGEKILGFWENNLLSGVCISVDRDGNRFEEIWANGNKNEGNRIVLKRTASEMLRLLNQRELPYWVPDSERDNCLKCGSLFSPFFNRRHHCRHCGNLFCATCSTRELKIPRIGLMTPQRVCDECFLEIKCYKAEQRTPEQNGE